MAEFKVTMDDADIRLDRWFKRHYPGFSHGMLEKHLRKGDIRLDGKKVKSSEHILVGQMIEVRCKLPDDSKEKKRPTPTQQDRPLDPDDVQMMQKSVLYKDANIIVINKPFGLAVQGGTKVVKSVDGLLNALCFDAPSRPKLVHRLDKDTSGVLVLARNANVAAKLSKAFSSKDHLEKIYWALVYGSPLPLRGTIDMPLAKSSHGEEFYERVGVNDEDGKRAITEYRVVESLARKFSWVELRPITGRTHQLRVHMAEIGCPIVGDPKYNFHDHGMKGVNVANKLHLHARRIIIPAEILGRKIDVSAPLPEHMAASFKSFEFEVPKP